MSVLLLGVGVLVGCVSRTTVQAGEKAAPGVAVVELFTSEGCSSCPPADAAVGDLIRQSKDTRVYVLAFHVDYWDDLGWPDPFAQRAFTDRQREYQRLLNVESVYTPQAVINGRAEFVGSNRARLRQSVDAALQTPAVGTLSATSMRDAGSAKIQIKSTDLPVGTLVRVAVVQPTASTAVPRGENGGRTLRHENVVRAFASQPLDAKGGANVTLDAPRGGWPKEASVILFAQQPGEGRVLNAAAIPFRNRLEMIFVRGLPLASHRRHRV